MDTEKFCTACEAVKPTSEFYPRPNGKFHPYCKQCVSKGLKCSPDRRTLRNFLNKVTLTSDLSSCWLWNRRPHHSGYATMRYNGRMWGAHQFSFLRFVGPIPDGLHVLHRCDVRICVRPDHLWLGTNADNVRDKLKKGRQPRGENNPLVKLTEIQVKQIRAMANDGYGQRQLGRLFKVDHSTVANILHGVTWNHI